MSLSFRDLAILDLIFDKNKCDDQVNECLRVQDTIDLQDDDEENSTEILKSKSLELEGVSLTEGAKFDEALDKFNEAIKTVPSRPSLYNNRAQLYRFLKEDEKTINDLNKAIELCGDDDKYKLTKCRAYTQRGIIKRKLNDNEGARDDFNESAKMGSVFSQQQLIELNPYAQLCNQMVTKILADYQK